MAKFSRKFDGANTYSTERLKTGISMASLGAPVIITAAAGAGVVLGSTTGWTDAVGINLDASVYSTTQGDTEGVARVVVDPGAVFKWRIAGSATEGTQALVVTNSAASAAGTVITITTGDAAPNSPTLDEGTAYCVSGANAGQSRKITSVAATTATVTVPFTNDLAVGDVFILVPWTPFDVAGNNLQFSTALTEADQSIAVGTGAPVRIVGLIWSLTNARTDSWVEGVADDHVLNVTT